MKRTVAEKPIAAVVSVWLLTAAVLGCGKSTSAPPAKSESKTASAAKSPKETQAKKKPANSVPAKPPLDQRKYGGLTHLEWQGRIKDLNPLDPEAAGSVEGLIALVRDHDVPNTTRTQASIVLGRMGKTAAPAVPVFIELLVRNRKSDHPFDVAVSYWAIRALAALGPVAKSATPELTRQLKDSSRPIVIRAGCLETLAQIGDADPQAVHTVIEMLTYRFHPRMPPTESRMLRGIAIECVGLIGPSASTAIRELIRLVRNDHEDIRRKAATALGAMRGQARDAIVPLGGRLTEDDSRAVRVAAADALAQTGELAVPLLKKLVEDDDDAEVRRLAARSLGKIGAAAMPAIDALDFALDDPDGWVRIYAAESLWSITGKPERVVPAYVEELKNPNRQIRIKAYRLLIGLGAKANSAKIGLKKLLSDERPYVRAVAARVLRNLESAR